MSELMRPWLKWHSPCLLSRLANTPRPFELAPAPEISDVFKLEKPLFFKGGAFPWSAGLLPSTNPIYSAYLPFSPSTVY